jgi:hypothetical protein
MQVHLLYVQINFKKRTARIDLLNTWSRQSNTMSGT